MTDVTDPTVTISGMPETFTGTDPITLTITFTEDVTGFEQADITISGATITSFSGGSSAYTAQITPIGTGDITVSVAAAVAQDLAGNDSEASNEATATNTLPAETLAQLAGFMQARARNLIANQPDLLAVINGGGSFDAQVTRGLGQFDLATDRSKPLWFRLSGNWSEAGTQKDRYTLGVIGSHFQPGENVWLGAMLQFDDASTREGSALTEGTGWLAGPYVVARHPGQPLFFEGSRLVGQTDNTVSPLGTHTDSFETERMLATAKLSGAFEAGSVTLMPSLGLAHVSDRQAAYTDSLANPIPALEISQTDAAIGLAFRAPIAVDTGLLTLTGGVQAIRTDSSGGTATHDGGSARVDLGLAYAPSPGTLLRFGGYYGGIGQSGYKAHGLSFDLRLEF